jgi:hypothetical protein
MDFLGKLSWKININPYEFNRSGGCPTRLKNDGVRQWGSDDVPYMMENNPFMFEPTNQDTYPLVN